MIRLQDPNRVRIHSLHLQNFKCFESTSFRFEPLTLLSGMNNTGKSSVLQALLLLRQSYQSSLLETTGLALNGDLTNIGTARDALFEGAKEETIGFDLGFGEGIEGKWRFNYNDKTDVLKLASSPVTIEVYEASLFAGNVHYLQAERIGPRVSYEMPDFIVRQKRELGPTGKYAAHFLSTFGSGNIAHNLLSHSKAKSLSLLDQVEAWMGEISPGTRIHLTPNPDVGIMILQYSFPMGNLFSRNYRATNVGFGITYTLPILVAILSSAPGSLLLIENPEAHLHPKGQAMMGDLLASAASCGIQVVVETHSDHVLNGIRVAVHNGRLNPDDVQLHFFQRREQDGQSQVVSPRIDRDGRLDQWPDGFFDEWEKSLVALLEPRVE